MSEDNQGIEETNTLNNAVATTETKVVEESTNTETPAIDNSTTTEPQASETQTVDNAESIITKTETTPEEVTPTTTEIDNPVTTKEEEEEATTPTATTTIDNSIDNPVKENTKPARPTSKPPPPRSKLPPKPKHAPPKTPPPPKPPKKAEEPNDDDIEHPDILGMKPFSFINTQDTEPASSASPTPTAPTTEAPKRRTAEETQATIREVSSILDSNPSTPEAKADCYKRLLTLLSQETFSDLDKLEFIYCNGKDNEGRSVVVLIGSRIPADTVPYERLLLYFIKTLDTVTEGLYSIVYIASNQSSANRPAASWILKAYGVLPRRFKKNIKQLLIVQCSVWVKLLLGVCYPFISKKFWNKLAYINNGSELEKYMKTNTVHFPSAVIKSLFMGPEQQKSEAEGGDEQKKVLFKRSLTEVAKCPELMHCGVPTVVYDCLKYLMRRGTAAHGILRLSGDRENINECIACYELGNFPNYDAIPSPHTVVNLLKLYLRELPEPLITFDIYERLIAAFQEFQKDFASLSKEEQEKKERELAETFGKILEDLPDVNKAILYNLFCFLTLVGFNKETTNMPPTNIATCIGPSIMWSKGADNAMIDPRKVLYDTQNSNNIAKVLVMYHEYIPKARCLFEIPDSIKEKIK